MLAYCGNISSKCWSWNILAYRPIAYSLHVRYTLTTVCLYEARKGLVTGQEGQLTP